jgi:flagellar biosynthetic protein FlhB
MTKIVLVSLPFGILAMVGGVAMGIVEAGFEPNLDLAQPKWERLNPLPKLQGMFSPQQAGIQTALSLARLTVIGLVAWSITQSALPKLLRLATAPLDAGVLEVLAVVSRMALWASLALAILAGADYGYNWWKHHQNIKMSKQELKEEHHAQEGDPHVKAKRRARAREIVRKGIAKELKRSDVVVTNPTHVAVALRYRPDEGVPVVTAKGYDEVAQYIKKLAKEQGIPCVENVPLARALAANVKAGRPIPVDLFAAVAEVLAFVFRLKRRGLRA